MKERKTLPPCEKHLPKFGMYNPVRAYPTQPRKTLTGLVYRGYSHADTRFALHGKIAGGCILESDVQLRPAIVKCINPTNLFTIAGFHYSEGHMTRTKTDREAISQNLFTLEVSFQVARPLLIYYYVFIR